MKKTNSFLAAAIIGAVSPYLFSVLTAVTEPVFQNTYVSWGFLIALCLVWVVWLLVEEKKRIRPENPVAWAFTLLLSGFPAIMLLWGMIGLYIKDLYRMINEWDHSFLTGLQWLFYIGTIIAAYVLWTILHLIIRLSTSLQTHTD